MKDKYEVIVPERIYIVNGLEEVRLVIAKYKLQNIIIRLIKEDDLKCPQKK